jgi:hypothetical protein
VKLLLTSQLDIWSDDAHRRYPPTVYNDLKNLKRSMEVYRLSNFTHSECRILIEKVAPKVCIILSYIYRRVSVLELGHGVDIWIKRSFGESMGKSLWKT